METTGIPGPGHPIKPAIELFEDIRRLEEDMTKREELVLKAMAEIIKISNELISSISDDEEDKPGVPGAEAA